MIGLGTSGLHNEEQKGTMKKHVGGGIEIRSDVIDLLQAKSREVVDPSETVLNT